MTEEGARPRGPLDMLAVLGRTEGRVDDHSRLPGADHLLAEVADEMFELTYDRVTENFEHHATS